jgi:hypothetical protein
LLSGSIKNGVTYTMTTEQINLTQLLKLKAYAVNELKCYRLQISTYELLEKLNELIKEVTDEQV